MMKALVHRVRYHLLNTIVRRKSDYVIEGTKLNTRGVNGFLCLQGLWFFDGAKKFIPFFPRKHKEDTAATDEISNVINGSDELFKQGLYEEAYELLKDYKLHNNGEILWRMCKALHRMSEDEGLSREELENMISEAHNLITVAYLEQDTHAQVNKWMAIILATKCDLEGLTYKVCNLMKIKEHLMKSHESDPTDFSVLYMLGQWCYSLASLSWFQRKIANLLYGPIPEASFKESHEYFAMAEKMKPRFYIPNTFMLGQVSLCLNKNFVARYYLNVAANLKPRTAVEMKYQICAQDLLTELQYFDLCKYSIFTDFSDI